MHKIRILSALCIWILMPGLVQAYTLSQAIRDSNAAQTRKLLSETTLNKQDKIKYLDLAEKICKLRHERLLLAEKLKSEGFFPRIQLPAAQLKYYSFGFMGCTAGAAIGLNNFKNYTIAKYLLGASVVTGIFLFFKLQWANFNYVQESYDQALTIKELLFDKEVTDSHLARHVVF